jgi:hypothetical protein
MYCPKKGNILRKFILPRKGNFAAWRITFTHTTMTIFCIKWYIDINSTLTCFGYFIFVRPNNEGRQNCKHGSTLQVNTTSTSLFWKPKFQYFNTICIILTRFAPISNIWRVIHSHQLHLTCFNTFFLFNLPLRAKQNSKHGSTLQVE